MSAKKFRYTYTAVAAAIIATTAVSFSAVAAKDNQNDAMAVDNAKISLSQAVTAAEQHAGGKASKAEYERTKTGWAWDVEVVNGAKVMDVRVDAANGSVLSANEDQADKDDEKDETD